jgi:hypothetical protein
MALLVNPIKCDPREYPLVHSGADYLKAVETLLAARRADPFAFFPFALLPLLHMTVELLAKAHAVRVDSTIKLSGRDGVGHRTAELIEKYSAKVGVFSDISADAAAMELIRALESAWLKVRYGEALTMVEADVFPRALQIANLLVDAYFAETGVHVLQRHYAKRSGSAP